MTSQQFGHAGHAIPSNIGMPVAQGQQLQYSQPMQQLAPRPIQPSHPVPSSQAIPMQYIQTSRPLTSVPPHGQQAVPHISNHMSGATPHSSYAVWVALVFRVFYVVIDYCHVVPFKHIILLLFSLHHLMVSSKIMLMHCPNTSICLKCLHLPLDNLGHHQYLRLLQLLHQCRQLECNHLVLHQLML